jgi:hypothetical protein
VAARTFASQTLEHCARLALGRRERHDVVVTLT